MVAKTYHHISQKCETYYDKFGDTYKGVGWTKTQVDVETRYRVMLEVIRDRDEKQVSVLDFGSGLSHLYEYIRRNDLDYIDYSSLDLSERFVRLSRQKYPLVPHYRMDVLENDTLGDFDYVVLSGVFNSKCDFSFDEMFQYFCAIVRKTFSHARHGIAFDVMSKQVDWEREDLFHLPLDLLANFLPRDISRHFVVRHDYGHYEYAVYVYRDPS